MKAPYSKQPISVSKQIDLLEEKGMEFYDRKNAARILSIIGYYRFNGYAYPFRNDIDHSGFIDDTSFEKVYSIYEFDRNLKAVLFAVLGRIEIAFRTLIIDKFSVGTASAQWYSDRSFFTDTNEHAAFLENLECDLSDSREVFIQHFRSTYSDKYPPAWIALQITSFGTLIKLFRNFNIKDIQAEVAKHFECESVERFISWMNTLVYLRNICSHHARLWNRPIKKRPEAYNFGVKTKRWSQQEISKLYYSICVIGYLLNAIFPGNSFKMDLEALFKTNSFVNNTKGKFLGFPSSWQSEFVW